MTRTEEVRLRATHAEEETTRVAKDAEVTLGETKFRLQQMIQQAEDQARNIEKEKDHQIEDLKHQIQVVNQHCLRVFVGYCKAVVQ